MRLSFDALVLQANLAPGEEITIDDIARKIFFHERDAAKKEAAMNVAKMRARRAALNMIVLGQAKPLPNKKTMEAILVTMGPGGQLQAVMNLSIRQAILRRNPPVKAQKSE